MSKIANTFERIYEYMDRNPSKVRAAWEQARQLPLTGPTAHELLCDEMGPYGYPRLSTSFFDMVVLAEPTPEPFERAWLDTIMEGFKHHVYEAPDIGAESTPTSVAGNVPATLVFASIAL